MDTLNKSPRGIKISESFLRSIGASVDEHIVDPSDLMRHQSGLDHLFALRTQTNYGCALPSNPYVGYFGIYDGLKMKDWVDKYRPIINKLKEDKGKADKADTGRIRGFKSRTGKRTGPAGTLGMFGPVGSSSYVSNIFPLTWYPVYFEAMQEGKRRYMVLSLEIPINLARQKVQLKKGFYYLRRPNEVKISRMVATHDKAIVKKQIMLLLKEANSFFLTNSQN